MRMEVESDVVLAKLELVVALLSDEQKRRNYEFSGFDFAPLFRFRLARDGQLGWRKQSRPDLGR